MSVNWLKIQTRHPKKEKKMSKVVLGTILLMKQQKAENKKNLNSQSFLLAFSDLFKPFLFAELNYFTAQNSTYFKDET